MIDKKRKIWFIIMGLIVLVSILAALLSIRGEKSQNSAVNKVNINTNNQTVNVVNSVTVGNSVYKNEQTKPDVSNLKDDVKQKIENYLNNYYKQLWEELADQYSEEDITEMLKQQENAELGDVGFKQSFEQVFINDKVVSYTYYMVGNLRGTPWEKVYGITFDVNTGNPIKIEDIVTSKQKYIEVCKEYVHKKIMEDKRYPQLNQGYDKIVDKHIESLEGYLTDKGIVCVIIQKYEIANGAAGSFEYTIPYDLIKDYIISDSIE